MYDLYQKIDKYVYEIRMMELDEYLYGMNRKKIDKQKASEMIMDAPNSKPNATMNFLERSRCRSSVFKLQIV